ncbi:unnamed protein product [Symbiodinium sp. CCMP2456]|nr:unnamed protein product [Symbiodinium sp. CCMP2456]
MSGSAVGPPPGFEGDSVSDDPGRANVTPPEPADVPSTPSLGSGDGRRAGTQGDASGSDDGSQGRRVTSDRSVSEPHCSGASATRSEWPTRVGTARGPDGEQPSHLRRSDGEAPDGRRASWSTAVDPPGSHRGSDPWTERDPWQQDYSGYGHPHRWSEGGYVDRGHPARWQDGSRYDDRGHPNKWNEDWDHVHLAHDPRLLDYGERCPDPWADGRDRTGPHRDHAEARQAWKQEFHHGPLRQHDSERHRAGPWADGRDDGRRPHDHGERWGAWDDARTQDHLGPRGWEPTRNSWREDHSGGGYGKGSYGRPSEKLSVPTFSAEDTDDLGSSARSYLRQVSAWRQMTLLPLGQQGLVLYQGLTGKAWIAAEELSVTRLGEDTGIDYFISWVSARFMDLEVARIGKAFSDYFRRMRRKPGQAIREFNTEYDRMYGRLREVGCNLPPEAAAWVYLDRLQLDEAQELNLLASVGNRYDLLRLQQAATLHDRGQRKPWESHGMRNKKTNYAHMTYHDDEESDELADPQDEDGIPEEVAEAWVTYQSAKERYRSQQRSRGFHGDGAAKQGENEGEADKSGGRDPGREAKLKAMKSKSFCSGCGRRGHWHKDDACPLNQSGGASGKGDSGAGARHVAMTTVLPADVYALRHVMDLVGVTDTACARTVAGTQWLQAYTDKLAELGQRPTLQKENEAYRFGAGKIHYSSFYVILNFELGNCVLQVRTSIITGDIPLLLSKTVLGKLGMVFDVEGGTADFRKIGLSNYKLLTTSSGHPAIPIVPAKADSMTPVLQVEDVRLQPKEQYMSVYAVAHKPPTGPPTTGIYHEKKLDPSVKDMLSQDRLQLDTFMAWWQQTSYGCGPLMLSLLAPSAMDKRAQCDSEEKPRPLGMMRKTELLEYAMQLGMTVHPSWTVIELRAVIREHLAENEKTDVSARMKKINSLNLAELRAKAMELDVAIPQKATKGLILKLIRESLNTPDNTLMTIGRWRGSEYQEIPQSYGVWAVREVERSDNSHPDLVRYARWFSNHQKEVAGRTKIADDVDETYQETIHKLSTEKDSWDQASMISVPKSKNPTGKGNTKTTPKRASDELKDKKGYMDATPDAEVTAEIEALELKLALLKDKAGKICEEDFVRGHYNQAVIYVNQHHEHYDHSGKFDWQDYSFVNCQKLLDEISLFEDKNNLRAIHYNDESENARYATTATKDYDGLVRYLNHFGKAHLGGHATWTSISVTQDAGTEAHRDSNNLKGSSNYCVTFGQDRGGQLWLEAQGVDEAQANGGEVIWKRDKSGSWIPGKTCDNFEKFIELDPHLKHCSSAWKGSRWCLTYHTARGITTCGPEIKKFLRSSNFPLPRCGKSPDGAVYQKKRATKATRNTIMNNTGKISVLMATLIITAFAYLADAWNLGVNYDPIVRIEIGGLEGTLEATELEKAVIEPTAWTNYLNPETQTNAYHFVVGANPKELRTHLDEMPSRAQGPIDALIRQQIDGGGEVMLRGERLSGYVANLYDYLQHRSESMNDLGISEEGGRCPIEADGHPSDYEPSMSDEDSAETIQLDADGDHEMPTGSSPTMPSTPPTRRVKRKSRFINEDYSGIVVYHDAAWANALDTAYDEEHFELTAEDKAAGLQTEGPFTEKVCKVMRVSSKVASSKAGQRVCHSIFGAETQACVEGVEGGQYLQSFYETVLAGTLVAVEDARTPQLCLSDRRLAIGLAALRQTPKAEKWSTRLPLGWILSGLQLGDVLTKPTDQRGWWDTIKSRLVIPIEVGEVGQTSRDFSEMKTSVKHKDRVIKQTKWTRSCFPQCSPGQASR